MGSEVRVEPATLSHVESMRGRMREADAIEVWRSSHLPIDEAVAKAFRTSTKCWVACLGEDPVMIFGVTPVSLISRIAAPWMLATDRLQEIRPSVARRSAFYVDQMQKGYSVLRNWVDADNTISIKWLRRLGFTIEAPEPTGPENAMFHYFWRKTDV